MKRRIKIISGILIALSCMFFSSTLTSANDGSEEKKDNETGVEIGTNRFDKETNKIDAIPGQSKVFNQDIQHKINLYEEGQHHHDVTKKEALFIGDKQNSSLNTAMFTTPKNHGSSEIKYEVNAVNYIIYAFASVAVIFVGRMVYVVLKKGEGNEI